MSDEFDQDVESTKHKPKTGRFKGTSQRLRKGKESHLSHRASLDWRQDSEQICQPFAEVALRPDIEFLKEMIMKSRTGESLLTEDGAQNIVIVYDTQIAQAQFYPQEKGGVITLNPHRPRGEILNTLTRKLRRAWQHRHGALVNPMSFEPDEAVLINRALQADVFMMAVKVAWELKLIGEMEAWDYMVGSPLSTITRAFESRAQKDFRSLNNGDAPRAAYDKFFEGPCTKLHDKRIIHQMLLDDAGYMKAPKKPVRASAELFQRLGEQPHGRNYLMNGQRPPTDVCYATVEDRSNANFLWFIKFERSFQEKELQMLQESVRASAEIVDFAKWSLNMGRPVRPRE